MSKIDARAASACNPADQRMIEAAVRHSAGGFAAVNMRICDRLREWLTQAARELLARQCETPGEETSAATTMNNLGMLLTDQGKLSEAEPLLQDALRQRRDMLGDAHPDTLNSMSNLAMVLKDLGKLSEAELLFRDALLRRRETLGDAHPETRNAINSLAVMLADQGRLSEAEPLYREVLRLRRELLGNTHRDTLTSVNNLAALLANQGKPSEAEPLYLDALRWRRETLGDRHPDTLTTVNNLAVMLADQGRLSEAEPLYRDVLRLRRETLGDAHFSTLTSVSNLAVLLANRGKLSEAEPLLRDALRHLRESLGEAHQSTLTAMNNLAVLLVSKGELSEAEPLYRDVLRCRREMLGESHPSTLTSMNNLAMLLKDQGNLSEAEPLLRDALFGRCSALGDTHPSTITSMDNLAALLTAQGNLSEAEPLYRNVLGWRRDTLGDTHPDTLMTINNLAVLLANQGKQSEVEAIESAEPVSVLDWNETVETMFETRAELSENSVDIFQPTIRPAETQTPTIVDIVFPGKHGTPAGRSATCTVCPESDASLYVVVVFHDYTATAELHVPAGAVDEPTDIRLALLPEAAQLETAVALAAPLVLIQPHGLKLRKPATLTLTPFSGESPVPRGSLQVVTNPGASVDGSSADSELVNGWLLVEPANVEHVDETGAMRVRIFHFSWWSVVTGLTSLITVTYPWRINLNALAAEPGMCGVSLKAFLNTAQHPPPSASDAGVFADLLPHQSFCELVKNIPLPEGAKATVKLQLVRTTSDGEQVLYTSSPAPLCFDVPTPDAAQRPPEPLGCASLTVMPPWDVVPLVGQQAVLRLYLTCERQRFCLPFFPSVKNALLGELSTFLIPAAGNAGPSSLAASSSSASASAPPSPSLHAVPSSVFRDKPWDLVLSYVIRESGAEYDDFVSLLKAGLEAKGYTVFLCETEIRGGDNFLCLIGEAIRRCRCFIAVLSPSYGVEARSPWTLQEAAMAGKRFVEKKEPRIQLVRHSGTFELPPALELLWAANNHVPKGRNICAADLLACNNVQLVIDELHYSLNDDGVLPSNVPLPAIPAPAVAAAPACAADAV